jgi:olefin beta-lactone synthetase
VGASTASCNIGQRLDILASAHPYKAALVLASTPRSGQSVYTYSELLNASNCIAAGLESHGIRRGMRAVLMARPSFEFFALIFALVRAGVSLVLVDPGIGLRNVTRCINECAPEVFIGMPAAHAIRLLYGWGRGSVRINVTTGRWGGVSLNAIRSAGENAPAFAPVEAGEDDEAAIIYTSGSTGLPKGAIYTHGNFAAQIEMLRATFNIGPDEIDLPAFPIFALIDFLTGNTAVVPDMRFPRPADTAPALILRTIQQHGVTTMFGSPVVINKVGRYGEQHSVTLLSLKSVVTAGAPASPEMQARFRQMLARDAGLFGIYGATESLPISCIDSREILEETQHLTAQGAGVCVGRPVVGVDVRIIKISDGAIPAWDDNLRLPVGEIGEIAIKGAAVTRAYAARDEANALTKIRDVDGEIIHRMGDVGYFDAQGRLWYCGRKAHRVITPDGTLFTETCEGVFNAHPLVYRTALVGVQMAGVTHPALCVELDGDNRRPDYDHIRGELLGLSCKHEQTREITTILFHTRFPTDVRHNSKIVREKLAVWAQKQIGR